MRSLIITLALATGCGQLDPRAEVDALEPTLWAAGVTAAPELRSACESASALWGEATGIYPACDAGRPLLTAAPPEGFSGWTYSDRVVVAPGFSEAFLAPLVAHELGHVLFGSGHPTDCSLMCADGLGPISQGDLNWVSDRL